MTTAQPTLVYDVPYLQKLIRAKTNLAGTEVIEGYWAGNSTNALLRLLPTGVQVRVIDPQTGSTPSVANHVTRIGIVITSGSAAAFKAVFPLQTPAPASLSQAEFAELRAACTAREGATLGVLLSCITQALVAKYPGSFDPRERVAYDMVLAAYRASGKQPTAGATPGVVVDASGQPIAKQPNPWLLVGAVLGAGVLLVGINLIYSQR